MSVVTINDEHLKNIANAIRQKSGETDKYKPSEMANAIKNISSSSYEPVLQNITIKPSINDQSFVADTGYDAIGVVNVSKVTSDIDSDINASNIKKGVNILGVDGTLEEGITPVGEIDISANGTYDVTNYASAIVEVKSAGGEGKYAPRFISFYGYNGGTELDAEVQGLDVSNVTKFTYMFRDATITHLDLSSWNIGNARQLSSMFYNCSKLENINLNNWDTSNVTTMSSMFHGCSVVSKLDLSHFNFTNVTNVTYMFYNCKGLKEVNLSNCNLPNATVVDSMFSGCLSLEKVDIRNLDLTNITIYGSQTKGMFYAVPKNCLIIVKNNTAKTKIQNAYETFTNVKTLAEYQAEGGV